MDAITLDTDEDLVAAARRGDEDAFGELVRRHQRRVVAVAIGILRSPDDARDIVQEAFLRAHRALRDFDGEARFSTWLHRIVINLCIDYARQRRPDTVGPEHLAGAPSTERDPHEAATDRELRARIHAALEQLTPAHRAVVLLREVEGFSYAEIARALGCAQGTVMSRLFHARRRLQVLLRGDSGLPLAA
jgi:RNA polymerase sigma-70 factor, ECF subfamily